MPDESPKDVSDEHRSRVRQVLFRLLKNNGVAVKENTEAFLYEMHGEYGTVFIEFDISPGFYDWALRISHALTLRTFTSTAEALLAEGKIKRISDEERAKTKTSEDPLSEQDFELAGLLAYLAMGGMPGKIKSAFFELGLESEKIFEGFLMEAMKGTDLVKDAGYIPPSMAGEIKALSQKLAGERKKFLTASIQSFSNKPRFERMPELYPGLLKVWQSAKKIYEANSESETWRAMVKVKYPELQFDDDLLTRITGRLEDLPEDIQTKLAEKDGDHTANTIALEHAARMCGAEPYQHSTRHYHNLKTPKTEPKESA